jgi:stage II sporulation protein GA (sporulation sigma-E factor processing peptidase)
MRVIYIDALFFLNLAVNYLLLLGTGHFSGYPFSRRRLLVSALFGAAYAVLACMPDFTFLNSVAAKAFSAVSMVYIGYGYGDIRSFGKRLLLFLLVSIVFGGGVFAAYIAGGGTPDSFNDGIIYARIPLKVLVISILVCYGIVSIFFGGAGRHGAFSRETAKVRVRYDDRENCFTALIDTGNTLRDPVTGAQVIVAEPEAVKAVFPAEIRGLIDRESVRDPAALMEVLATTAHAVRFRLIPFRTVDTECGMMIVFRPDCVEIGGKKKKRILVALSPVGISEGAGYCALV